MNYFQRLKDVREDSELKQEEIAKVLGIQQTHYSRYERGKSMMGIAPKVTTEQMINAYKTLINKAHQRNIQVYLVTRSAWKGYTRNILNKGDDIEWTPEIDQMRKDINAWIKTNPADGYIDLDDLCQDEDCTELRSEYVTDGVHFTLEGQKAVVEKLPVRL